MRLVIKVEALLISIGSVKPSLIAVTISHIFEKHALKNFWINLFIVFYIFKDCGTDSWSDFIFKKSNEFRSAFFIQTKVKSICQMIFIQAVCYLFIFGIYVQSGSNLITFKKLSWLNFSVFIFDWSFTVRISVSKIADRSTCSFVVTIYLFKSKAILSCEAIKIKLSNK